VKTNSGICNLALKDAKQFWRSAYDYLGPMFCFKVALPLFVHQAINEEYTSGNKATKQSRYPSHLLSTGSFSPVPAKAPFLLLVVGFVLGCFGFLGFVICIDVGGTWRQFWGTLGTAGGGVVIFHVGMWLLLR
jgi:hypothetical protein